MSCFWLIGSLSGADRAQEKQFFTDRLICVYIPCIGDLTKSLGDVAMCIGGHEKDLIGFQSVL